jgi:hypothetical protein
MRLRLAVLLVLLAVAPSAARAATIAVNTTSASTPGDGLCSLSEAVAAAGGFTVTDCTNQDTSGIDDIVLPAGSIDTDNLSLENLRLHGQGADSTILHGNTLDRVVVVTGTVSADGLTVTNGHANQGDVGVDGSNGGGILVASGSLTLSNCAVTNNVAGHGGQGADHTDASGGAGGYGGSGGGIYVAGGASLTLTRCVISGNRAGAGGAGGSSTSSSMTAVGGLGGSGGSGGGVFAAFDSQVTIDSSTVADNHAGDGGPGAKGIGNPAGVGGAGGFGGVGGGLASTGGPVTISASTFSANTGGMGGDGGEGDGYALTTASGTGGSGSAGGSGGGLYIAKGISDPADALTNVTIAGNAAGDGGDGARGHGATDGVTQGASTPGQGAVGGDAGDLLVARAQLALLHDTIVAGQVGAPGADYGGAVTASPGGGPGILYSHLTTMMTVAKSIVAGCAGDPLGDFGFNLGSGGCPGSGADPQLGPLQDNGGPTQTMRPAAGSPAVDAVPSNMGCAAADQRGVPRPVGIACDIGAVELAAPTVVTGDNSGLTVNGTADGHGLHTIVSFQYGPTTSYGSSLTAGPLNDPCVTPFSVTLPPMEPGTYHYRTVATNTDGTSVGLDHSLTVADSVQPPPASKAPVVTKLTFKPRRLRRGHKATVRFRITEVATVRLSFAKRRGKRYRAAGSLTRRVHAGAVKLTFKRRALKPGRYRLTLVATDVSGRRSKPVRATFRVVAA